MSTTADRPMTIKAARALLSDTRGVPDRVVEEAQGVIRAAHLQNAGLGTCRCGCAVWIPGEFGLVCERCGTMSEAARQASEQAAAEKRAVQKAKEAAEAPTPREALQAVAAELAGARAEEAKLETAAVNARDQLATARIKLDAAEEALPAARAQIAEQNVLALLSGKTKPSRGVAAEESALEAARNGMELATTAVDTIADMLGEVRYQLPRLEKRHREAALAVLADEVAPLFIARANTARTEFISASKGLQWLEHAGAAPSTLIASELKWSWHHSPEVWQAKGNQLGPDLDGALKALLADPRASTELA
jgi:hypothetical protein